ncbi:MAG: hypothetical protein JF595_14660 [Sphingomonadales bacterium]|nr:hypothetical protein [Sphingomonadales bacterium]
MNGDAIVWAVAIVAALVLAARGLRSYRLDRNRTAVMAAVWVAIIAALAIVIQRFAT